MKTKLEDITPEHYELFKKHRRLTAYNQNDVAEIDMLMKTYINEHHKTCLGCGSGALRKAKDEISIYLVNGEERIKAALEAKQEPKPKIDIVVEESNPNKNNNNKRRK